MTTCHFKLAKEGKALRVYLSDEMRFDGKELHIPLKKLCGWCQENRVSAVDIVGKGNVEEIIAEILLSNYAFDRYKSQKAQLLREVGLIGPKNLPSLKEAQILARGVHLARDLVNGNADDITPQELSKVARGLASKKVKVHILGKKEIKAEGLGLLEAVSRGASLDPALIVLEYRGAPKMKEKTAIICKGITFDTGGLLVKPRGGMEEMRADMAGSAVGLATLQIASQLELPINLCIVIAACENAIGPLAYKPGDIYFSHSGKSVEISDTDAEGRLVLADAISYAKKHLKPTQLIDIATLTGAVIIALGEEMAALFSNEEKLAKDLLRASQESNEPLWRMPLYQSYRKHLNSDHADIRNSGEKYGRGITAALFLQEFVGDTPWAHLDIAGPAFLSKAVGGYPKGATGFGIRLLLNFLSKK